MACPTTPKDLKEQLEEFKVTSQEVVARQDNLQNQIRLMQSTMEALVSTISDLKKQLAGKQVKDLDLDSLPQGYYFLPSDKMLINALKSKILNQPYLFSDKYRTLNFYDYHPQQLSELYEPGRERVWYFFVKKDKSKICDSVKSGIHRRAKDGCWRGCDHVRLHIKTNGYTGFKNFFGFFEDCEGEDGWGLRTDWVMQEYLMDEGRRLDGWTLCKMYKMDFSTCKRKRDEMEFESDMFDEKYCDFHLLELKLYHIFGDQLEARGFDYKDDYEEGTLSCHLRN